MASHVRQLEPPQALPRHLLGISSKMYFSHAQTMDYLSQLSTIQIPESIQLFFLPSFVSIYSCAAYLQSRSAKPATLLGGQNCAAGASGAQTGSISAQQLREIGCNLVELGHAERRAPPMLENGEIITAKVLAAVAAGLVPLVCIGEPVRKGDSISSRVGYAVHYIMGQVIPVVRALSDLRKAGHENVQCMVFAYEPVWAIGAQKPADAEHVLAVVRAVKQAVQKEVTSDDLDVRFLYGGSAGPGTWNALKGELDGLFLGRFAHDVNNVRQVVQEMLE